MGYMSCLPVGNYIGNDNVTFIIDPPFGRSLRKIEFVDKMERIFMRQTFPIITEISPRQINPKVGAIIQVKGKYLLTDAGLDAIKVKVGNQIDCKPYASDASNVFCRITHILSPVDSIYLSGRGLDVWQWPLTRVLTMSELQLLDVDNPQFGVVTKVSFEAIYADPTRAYDISNQTLLPLSNTAQAVVMRTAFIAPKTSEYSFRIIGRHARVLTATDTQGNNIFSITYDTISKKVLLSQGQA
ncbi:Fibrocystin-L [Cichlidogyrus casuarinus]|uniref:Fibrocystin-L n=1 Tax=Cichlidogyrus casuarinus TaxID=1844966 RepID=A0ABD2QCU5_9PLAT